MYRLVFDEPGSYIEDRHSIDGILIANDVIDDRRKIECPGIMCKIDLTKTYDHVSGEFLDYLSVWVLGQSEGVGSENASLLPLFLC